MTPDSNAALAFRLNTLEREMREAASSLRLAEKHEEQISGASGLTRQVNNLADEVASLRKAIIGFALGLPVAGITFLLGVLALVQP